MDPVPMWLEEDYKAKLVGEKRLVKEESVAVGGKPAPFKLLRIEGEGEITGLFEGIIKEIREYLEGLSRAENEGEEQMADD